MTQIIQPQPVVTGQLAVDPSKQAIINRIQSVQSAGSSAAADRVAKLCAAYKDIRSKGNIGFLLMSMAGAGKTTLLATMPLPILIDHFDYRGSKIIDPLIDSLPEGTIVVRPFWNVETAYRDWVAQFQYDIATGFHKNFATYAIDTLTTFSEAVVHWAVAENNKNNTGIPFKNDYLTINGKIKNAITLALSQDCHVVLTTHLDRYKDDITGNLVVDVKAIGGLKSFIPSLFTEKYLLYVDPQNNSRWIRTTNFGAYQASTQIGAHGVFNDWEPPDLRAMIKKAGYNSDDKPNLLEAVNANKSNK